jgi:predicted ArsR family transcriptional regulator
MRHETRRKRKATESVLGTTKGKILVTLCWKRQTVSELADAMGLTDNAVRAQLQRLERDGMVAKAGSRRGVRKPHVEYELTSDALKLFPRAYEPALIQLVNVLTDRFRTSASRALLLETGRRLLHEHLGEPHARTPRQRVAAMMKRLNGADLGIDVSERSGKTLIRSCSCPIASVIAVHPEVCGLFASLLGEMLGADVSESCEKGESARCRFEVMG